MPSLGLNELSTLKPVLTHCLYLDWKIIPTIWGLHKMDDILQLDFQICIF